MAIKISRIEVDKLGPLASFKNDLRAVTLIYGHNEKGKTFLVEFILKSLFKNLTGFKDEFRISKPSGKVIVTGLENEPVTFSPNSKNKLESKWEENGQGVPSNMARLLVVKGGDANIERNSEGISQDAIREILSNQGILDSVQRNIGQKSIQGATIESDEITGPNFGDLLKRKESRSQVKVINQLLDKINIELADGDGITLENKITVVEERIRSLEAAKKYAAYCVAQEKAKADSEIKRFDDAQFQHIDEIFGAYSRKKEFLISKQKELDEASQRGMHYPWLKEAVEEYQKGLGQTFETRLPVYFIIALLLSLASGVLIILEQRWPALVCILFSVGIWFWYFQKVNKMQVNQAEAQELGKIRAVYHEKFNEPCRDISSMRVKLEAIAVDYHAVQLIDKDIDKGKGEIRDLTNEIQQGLKGLGKSRLSPEQWEETISKFRQKLNDLNAQSNRCEKDLAHYDIDPSDFIDIDPGILYKRTDYDNVKIERDRLIKEKNDLEQSLQILKSEVQAVIGEYSVTDWAELIHKLREMRSRKLAEYTRYTSGIIAGKLLHQTIGKIREQEDEKISENLNSAIVREPLKQISKHYVSVVLDDGSVKIMDEFNQEFNFNELSTGAREQIFLALRMGFASKVMQGDTAFMILDDAFQHSDWERRPGLIDNTFKFAKKGWQVIYFTMDDNIRDLFDQKGKKSSKGTYVRIDI